MQSYCEAIVAITNLFGVSLKEPTKLLENHKKGFLHVARFQRAIEKYNNGFKALSDSPEKFCCVSQGLRRLLDNDIYSSRLFAIG